MSDTVVFSRDELDLIVEFAGCSLDESPGSNWVQEAGGLPEYICRIAKAVKRSGKTTSQAVSIAVSRVKKWAAGADDVDADTRAKAAKALAEWEALKAKSKSRSKVKASAQGEILCLSDSVKSFNVDSVRRAFYAQVRNWSSSGYIREMWSDHIIMEAGGEDADARLFRIDYTVDEQGQVVFGQAIEVRTQYVTVDSNDMVGRQMSNSELRQLMATVGPCYGSATDKVLLTIGSRPSALSQVLVATGYTSALDTVLLAAQKLGSGK